jgi:glutathione peroxidase
MKNIVIATFFSCFVVFAFGQSKNEKKSIYDFNVETIDGLDFNLGSLKGKKVMVVNTASKCGLTPQYKELESLYQKYGGEKFVIIGFPANNFMSQEPGSNSEIKEFCSKNYGVSFPMMAKISVKGADMAPVYKWLTHKEENGVMDSDVQWNFQKYLIDEKGNLIDVVPPKESPMSERITKWLEKS